MDLGRFVRPYGGYHTFFLLGGPESLEARSKKKPVCIFLSLSLICAQQRQLPFRCFHRSTEYSVINFFGYLFSKDNMSVAAYNLHISRPRARVDLGLL